VVDSTRPGEDAGELDAERLAWLDAALAEAPGTPTLVAMHHPPLVTGMPAFDAIGLPPADRTALAEVIARHPQVQRIVAGHVHRTIAGSLAASDVLIVPSTYVQARLAFGAQPMSFVDEPAGFAVHALVDGEVASHIQPVG
jgi:Icc protein